MSHVPKVGGGEGLSGYSVPRQKNWTLGLALNEGDPTGWWWAGPPDPGQAQGTPDFRGVQLQVVFTDSLENLTSFCLGTRSPHALCTFEAPPALEPLQRKYKREI